MAWDEASRSPVNLQRPPIAAVIEYAACDETSDASRYAIASEKSLLHESASLKRSRT
jgi:hypothetical protein